MARSSDPIPFRPKGGAFRKPAVDPEPWRSRPGKPAGLPSEPGQPTDAQRAWLMRGLDQPGGKLPLFDLQGERIDPRTIRSCVHQGWAEPWFMNPLKPDWLVCKLTAAGRKLLEES